MTDQSCERFQDLSAELALGILDGRSRAEALAHVEHCPVCQHDLMTLGMVADQLVEVVPSAEPPVGFETKVLARLNPQAPMAGHRRPALPRAQRAAATAAAIVMIGAGGWAIGHYRAHPGPAVGAADQSSGVRTASFVVGDHYAGQVVAYGGGHPWVGVAVDAELGDRTVRCQLVERNGTAVTVGTFTLVDGHGYWGAPIRVSPSSLKQVQLLDRDGATIATAAFAI